MCVRDMNVVFKHEIDAKVVSDILTAEPLLEIVTDP